MEESKTELEAMREMLEEALEKLARRSEAEAELKALHKANPRMAVRALERECCPVFMYACRTLKEKQELLKEAMGQWVSDNTLEAVVAFLYHSLNPAEFYHLVFPHEVAVARFLKHLGEERDYEEYLMVCWRYQLYKEYFRARFKRALSLEEKEREAELRELLSLIDNRESLRMVKESILAVLYK
jgi:hypothetical protein